MRNLLFFFLLFFCSFSFSQEVKPIDSIKTDAEVITDLEKANTSSKIIKYNPTKAGLYSAVLPGLGQYYNKKYWKIPIVWGAIGTGVGVILYNDKQYRRYRNAFTAQLNGQTHEFSNIPGIDATVLGNVQDRAKRYRDYSIAITSLIYILNIMDAVVDSHLDEQRKDPDLAIKPAIIEDNNGIGFAKAGISLSYRF